MNKLQRVFQQLPECLLLVGVLTYWILNGMTLNYLVIGLGAILLLQIILKNKVIGFAISVMLILASIYMLMAMWSEFNEFASFTEGARDLLLVGLPLFLSILTIGLFMLRKQIKSNRDNVKIV